MKFAALLLLAIAPESATTPMKPLAAPRVAAPSASVCDQPVLMVVAGPTHDRLRMLAYGKAIAESGLYQQLGGYYVNLPQALATFEGTPPLGYTTLIVRFPVSIRRIPRDELFQAASAVFGSHQFQGSRSSSR